MLKEKIENLKMILTNKSENNKKKIENLVFFLVLLIITIIAINVIWSGDKNKNTVTNSNKQLALQPEEQNTAISNNQEYNINKDLENILSKINGAGKVEVLVTYTESSELVAMYNENVKQSITEETDSNGGVRTIEQKDNNKEIVYKEENGEKLPITQKVVMPQIEGAIILAEGANNAEVKNNIILAVEAVTGLNTHKIQVFELKTQD